MYYFVAAFGCVLFAGWLYERIGAARDRKRNKMAGKLVEIGERKLHLICKGTAAPTVVIEQGAGEPAELWLPIQERIAEIAQVCVYDRAGYGWSDPVGGPRSIQDRAEDLYRLLMNAGLPGPYILVAHSYGGFIVRWFAKQHPEQVAGLVLVDTGEEGSYFRRPVLRLYSKFSLMLRIMGFTAHFGLPRALRQWFPALRAGIVLVSPAEHAAAADDIASLQRVDAALRQPAGFGTLNNLPLTVITHGQPFPGPFAVLEDGWSEGQRRLAALSANSELIVAANSNHMIHLDEPEIVIEAIRRIHASVRH